jgi:type IV pilus assembly protein PilQ
VEQVQIQSIGEGAAARVVETRQTRIEPLTAPREGEAPLILRGLGVVTDERLNAITLVGDPNKIQLASNLLLQQDARRRQVAVNVKVVDVNLSAADNFSTSFSFGIGDTFFSVDGGQGTITTGPFNPPTAGAVRTPNGVNPPVAVPGNVPGDAEIFINPSTGQPTIFGPGNNPAQPGITADDFTTDGVPRVGTQQLVAPSQDSPIFFDVDGVPRRLSELTIGGGSFVPLDGNRDSAAIDLVNAATSGSVFLGADGTPRRLNELTGFGGVIAPLLQDIADLTFELPGAFRFPRQFLGQLQAQVTNGNAKILTDPTVVVQEGQSAQVRLTQQVVGNVTRTQESSEGITNITTTFEIEEVGLLLDIRVDRIDDNGFVSLSVEPTVSAIGNQQVLESAGDQNVIALIARRSLTTGQVRMRDGQTLILSGIIQEQDRTTITKVPILGDIPIIGALFRNTSRQTDRAEVIVLVTPQILDDSQGAGFGYNYTPSPEVQKFLQQRQPR